MRNEEMVQELVILVSVALSLAFAGDDPVDSIKKKITKAEETHRLELARAQADVIKWLDGREAAARKKGDKATVNIVKQQREKLETEGTIPKPIPVNTSRKVDTARDLLDASYASLMKEALVANLDDLADEIEDKRVQLSKEKSDSNIFKAVRHFARNMVTNGNFEFPICNGQTLSLNRPDTHWTGDANDDFICDYTKHNSQFLQWNGTVSQTVKGFIQGERYVLTYYVSTLATKNSPKFWGTAEFTTKISGEVESFSIESTAADSRRDKYPGTPESPWQKRVVVFKALADDLDLQFEHRGNTIAQIDNVSILPYLDN
jgi:hypothetical protein